MLPLIVLCHWKKKLSAVANTYPNYKMCNKVHSQSLILTTSSWGASFSLVQVVVGTYWLFGEYRRRFTSGVSGSTSGSPLSHKFPTIHSYVTRIYSHNPLGPPKAGFNHTVGEAGDCSSERVDISQNCRLTRSRRKLRRYQEIDVGGPEVTEE